MHSSKKVIKASSIRLARQGSYDPASESTNTRRSAASPPLSDAAGKQKRSADPHGRGADEQKVQSIRQEAFELGITEGMKRGAAQQREETSQLVNSLSGLVSELMKARKEFLGGIEKEVVRLAFAIAGKILNHEISTDKEAICKVIRNALTKIADHEGMRIRVNPVDYRYLTEENKQIFPGLEGITNLVLEEDTGIGRGGVVIVSALGELDARLDRQLSTLEDALAGE